MRTYTRKAGLVLASVAAASLVAGSASVASAADEAELAPKPFPSATSTVVGSTGFIGAEEVGYFWSAARGDSVSETITGPKKIKKAVLSVDVVYNGLVDGATTDWTVSINGKDVGDFSIAEGFSGDVNETFTFKKIKGKSFDVKMYMTNEVPGGDGAITLRYAGEGAHSIDLLKK